LPPKSVLLPYLAPKLSRALALALLGIHVLAFLAAWLNPLPVWLRLLLSLSVLLSLWLSYRSKPQIIGIRLQPEGYWLLDSANNTELEASLLGSSIVNPWFVLLHFQAETRRYSLLICRDSLDVEAFRRLRVALKVTGMGE